MPRAQQGSADDPPHAIPVPERAANCDHQQSAKTPSKARWPGHAQVSPTAKRTPKPDIASQLFMSPRTVEYHLHKILGP